MMPTYLTFSTIRWGSRVKLDNPGNGVTLSLHLSVVSTEKDPSSRHRCLPSPTYIYIYIYTCIYDVCVCVCVTCVCVWGEERQSNNVNAKKVHQYSNADIYRRKQIFHLGSIFISLKITPMHRFS